MNMHTKTDGKNSRDTIPAVSVGEKIFVPESFTTIRTKMKDIMRDDRHGTNKAKSRVDQSQKRRPGQASYKVEVEAILGHETRGKKMGVRFQTKWKMFRVPSKERSRDILDKLYGREQLARYLERLSIENSRRFVYIMERQPDLAKLLYEEPNLQEY